MKSLFNGLLCMSLMAFAVGCGKENSSGGGSSYRGISNSKYLNTSSRQVIETVNRWYKSRTEATNIQGLIKVDQVQLTNSYQAPNQECDSLDLGLFEIPYCTYTHSGSINGAAGQVLSTKNVAIYPDNRIISEKGNTALNNIFNGSNGEIVQATSQGNKVYRLDFLKNNVVTTYILDLNYHSLLNPVQKSSSADHTKINVTRASCSSPAPGACVGVYFLNQ